MRRHRGTRASPSCPERSRARLSAGTYPSGDIDMPRGNCVSAPDGTAVLFGTGDEGTLPAATVEVAAGRRPTTCVCRSAADGTLLEVAGIEPASSGTSTGLLRAQLAVVFSAPPFTRARRCRAQSLLGFPPAPVTGTDGDPPSDARSGPEALPG